MLYTSFLSIAKGRAQEKNLSRVKKVFKMLLAKGRITRGLIAMLSNWRHSGFQVFGGNRLGPEDERGMENLGRYNIRASFHHKWITCLFD